tara:strand:- start:44 stop:439 length:396 start_codon:yes stop_codon:yes gene_type:complete
MAYKQRLGKLSPTKMYGGGGGDGDKVERKPVRPIGVKPAGIQSFPTQKPSGSMAGLQPLVKKPPTGTSTTPPPRKARKKFKNTKVGKFAKKVGDIQINLPRVRLPKLGLGKKPSGKRCTRCSKKLNRTRGR